jgi:hypothetical protein
VTIPTVEPGANGGLVVTEGDNAGATISVVRDDATGHEAVVSVHDSVPAFGDHCYRNRGSSNAPQTTIADIGPVLQSAGSSANTTPSVTAHGDPMPGQLGKLIAPTVSAITKPAPTSAMHITECEHVKTVWFRIQGRNHAEPYFVARRFTMARRRGMYYQGQAGYKTVPNGGQQVTIM